YGHGYSWLVYNMPDGWIGATRPKLRTDFIGLPLGRGLLGRPQLAGSQPGPTGLNDRPEQRDQTERHDRAHQTVRPEHAEAALRSEQRLAERLFGLIAEHDRQNHRCQRVVALLHEVADDPEHQHHHYVEGVVVYGVSADRAEHHDDGRDDAEGNAETCGEQRHAGEHDDQAHDVAHVHAGDETPDEILLFGEQKRSRLQTPDQQATEQHGSRRRTGHAEGDHRKQRRRAGGMGGGFRRDHTFDLTGAELVAVLGNAFGDAVAHERGGRRAGRADTHPATDEARAQRHHPVARQLGPGLEHDFRIELRDRAAEAQPLLHGEQNFAD